MSVNKDGVQLFDGIADTDDMFITTMEEMDKEVGDEITIPQPVFRYLKDANLIQYRKSIGTHVPVKLLDKENSTVKDFAHYDDVDNTPQDALSEAKFSYGQTVGTQMYSRQELVQNSGEEQMIDLVETKTDQLLKTMANKFGSNLMGSQDADGRTPMGLGRVMAYNQSCGGILPTTAGFEYWNPQRGLKSDGATQYALATEMRDGIRRLTRLCTYQGETPDVLIAGEDLYDEMQKFAESKLQLSIKDLKDEKGWGAFNMFPYNSQVVIYDESMDPKTGWLMNFRDSVKVRIHSGTNFQFEKWQMMTNKVAKKRDCLLYAAVFVKKRNSNGFITFT
ncbi:MAG: phage major capsid protein [Gammaproteobacteria bacterium]|nr:phage major capsid protein [Gammaproteobacteria bacterium]